MRPQDIIRQPLITEKLTAMQHGGTITYGFEVASRANKIEIKKAVETQFKVKVAEVRTATVHGKWRRQGRYEGRRSDWKKAFVRLKDGEKPIEFFEGV